MADNATLLKMWKFITDGIQVLGKGGPDTVDLLVNAGNQLADSVRILEGELVLKDQEIEELQEALLEFDPGIVF